MDKIVHTEIAIDSSAQAVWEILTDFKSYPEWNPYFRKIEGEAAPGSRLNIWVQPRGSVVATTFKVRLIEASIADGLRWHGSFVHPRLFLGDHSFKLREIAPGRVRLINKEAFSGVLAPFMTPQLEFVATGHNEDTTEAFREMNQALKKRAEESGKQQDGRANLL